MLYEENCLVLLLYDRAIMHTLQRVDALLAEALLAQVFPQYGKLPCRGFC